MIKNYWPRYAIALFGFMSWQIVAGASAHAAATEGITLTPTAIDLPVEPGSRNVGSLQVLNQGKVSYDFNIYMKPYHVDGEGYTPDFTLLPGTTDISDWFQFTTLHAHIEPGQVINIGYVIVVPRDATPGGHYAVAFVETQPQITPNRIIVNERVGEIFYVHVAGPTTEKSDIASWTANWLQEPPLTASLRLENAGSTHYFADVHIKVSDILGNTKYILDSRKVVLPRTIRSIVVSWDKAPPLSLFKVGGEVDFLGQKRVLPTRYVLVLSATLRRILIFVLALFIIVTGLLFIRQLKHKQRR